jgi:hypothetical protein
VLSGQNFGAAGASPPGAIRHSDLRLFQRS